MIYLFQLIQGSREAKFIKGIRTCGNHLWQYNCGKAERDRSSKKKIRRTIGKNKEELETEIDAEIERQIELEKMKI